MECLDINQHKLDRGLALAQKKELTPKMQFTCSDINGWQPKQQYHIVLAKQSLHHSQAR
jgi:trans-aconitate methyltransferase